MKQKMTKVLSIFLCAMTCFAYSTPVLAGTELASKDETQVTVADQQATEQDSTANNEVASTSDSAKADVSSNTAKEKTADSDNDAEADTEESGSDSESLPQSGTDDNISWAIDAKGAMTISGTGEMKDYENNDAPWTAYKTKIVSVKFEEGITKIGFDTFNECSSLTEIDIPSSVTVISGYAFYHCTALETVNLPANVGSLGYATFGDCTELKEVTFNNDNISIDSNAFLNISDTGQLTFKCNSGSSAWQYASAHKITRCCLKDHVWNGDRTVDKEATPFWEGEDSIHCKNCDVRKDIETSPKTDSDGGVENNITWTIDQTGLLTVTGEGVWHETYPWYDKGYDDYVTKLVVGTGITTVDEYIYDHINLKSVELSDTVEEIEDTAFEGCPKLQEITIPNDNITIYDDTFSNCSSDLVIRCNPDSKAYEYAKANGISWQCINHTYGEYQIDTEATCEKAGSKHRICTTCQYKDVEVIPAGHQWEEQPTVDVAATCEKEGSQSIHCKACDATKDTQVIPATGHKWTTYRKNAGYLKDGTSYSYCTVCKVKKNVKTLAGYSKYVVKKLKVKKGKKSFKVTWKKASKANRKVISGYQIRYSKKSNMASSKYVKAGKSSKGKKIKKLSKKTKYYVQVRNYTKKGGKTYYSKWSGKKTVRTK